MTFWEYKKIDYKVELAFETVVPLKVTFFTNEVPSTVVLSMVYKNWSLLLEAKVHSLGLPADGVAEYVRRVELQLEHWVLSFLVTQLSHVEWQKPKETHELELSVYPSGQSETHLLWVGCL